MVWWSTAASIQTAFTIDFPASIKSITDFNDRLVVKHSSGEIWTMDNSKEHVLQVLKFIIVIIVIIVITVVIVFVVMSLEKWSITCVCLCLTLIKRVLEKVQLV